MEILQNEEEQRPSMEQFNELSQSVDDIQKEVNELDTHVLLIHESAIVDLIDVLLGEETLSSPTHYYLEKIKKTFYGEPKQS